MTVRIYRNTDFGAPEISNVKGSLIGLLDACLVNGYGDNSITITRVGNLATITTANPHGFVRWSRIDISGANEPEYNGIHEVTKVGNNSLTFEVAGSPVTPATGTIIYRLNSAGWTSPYTATNKAVYAMGGPTGMMFDVDDDTYTTVTNVSSYETMDGVASGTNQWGIAKWQKATGANRPWVIIATDEVLYFWVALDGSLSRAAFHHFAAFDSNKAGDTHNVYLVGSSVATSAHYTYSYGMNPSTSVSTHSTYWFVARNYLELPPGDGCGMGVGMTTDMLFPTRTDNNLYMTDLYLGNNGRLMGTIRGIKGVSNKPTFADLEIFHGSGDLLGRTFIYLRGYNGKYIYIELTDNW